MTKFNFQPIMKEETTKERVYKQIKSAILYGQISNNEIFTEVQLAESLNTSRTPVREALLDLTKEGLVVTIPRKGLAVRKVTDHELEQIFLLRTSIEGEVIKKATRMIADEQVEGLEQLCLEQEKAMKDNDDLRFISLDQEFHASIMKISNYDLIEQLLLNLHDLTRLIGLQVIKRHNRMDDVLFEHRQIIKALKEKDENLASKYMIEHLSKTKEALQYNH